MGFVGAAFEFRVVLDADVKIISLQLHGLHDVMIRRGAADGQAGSGEIIPEVVVEFVELRP